ncbi:putative F-box/LRR-repeat protein 9 [Triticum aestivum]|uniref:putative F-box/LRR-repeat protein 9 n=1 Tax=Triticum aestivum TaxID=4565 RepID=UPI0008429F11|nr:putative F-box/LRR-repeat protein 9 [Triticum aestivum]
MGIRSRRRARAPAADPPSRRRRRKDVQHVRGLPWEAERRDWAALPRDVLWIILSLVPQADVLHGAGRACVSWRRLALDESLLWRHIDLAADEDSGSDSDPLAGWQVMARTAVRRSGGRCESFRGRVSSTFLLFLARTAPLLRSLHVTCRYDIVSRHFIHAVAKQLPLLEQLVLSGGRIERASLAALVKHWPRLRLLHAGGCHTWSPIDKSLRERLEGRIEDLRLPYSRTVGRYLGPIASARTGRLRVSVRP